MVIGASALVALLVWPERAGYAYQVLAVMTGVLLTIPVVGDPDNVGGQAGPIDPFLLVLTLPAFVAALLAAPWRRPEGPWRPRVLMLAAVGAVPAAWYGIDQALLQRNTFPPTADPHHNAHWWAMAIIAFAIVLVMAAAALPGRGWRLGTGLAAATAIGIGLASLAAGASASALAPLGAVGPTARAAQSQSCVMSMRSAVGRGCGGSSAAGAAPRRRARRVVDEQHPAVGARMVLTERAREHPCRRVGRDGHSVAAVARDLGVGWHTTMRAVIDHGEITGR